MNDLKTIFNELSNKISVMETGNSDITLNRDILPCVPDLMETNDIYIKKSEHYYGSYRVDLINCFAHKETYISLGLLILSVIFDKQPREITLKINHKESDIKYFKIENNSRNIDDLVIGLNSMPYAFSYYPESIGRHPFIYTSIEIGNLPWFSLTNEVDCLINENEWKLRDTVKGCGTDEGSAYFAELLLNFGLASNLMTQIDLEGECGFRGVGRGSIEVSLFLPGHLFWTQQYWL